MVRILERVGAALLALTLILGTAFAEESGEGASGEHSYEICITEPSGWYAESANITIEITGDEWDHAEINKGRSNIWMDITDSIGSDGTGTYSVTENGFYTVRVVSSDGEAYCVTEEVTCLDKTAPTVQTGIADQLLHAEAEDSQSGVYGIYVDDTLYMYTTLTNGALDIRLSDYAQAGEIIRVKAVDNAGNVSEVTELGNPYYTTATESPSPTKTEEATPTNTPAPTTAPTSVVIYTSSGTDTPAATATPKSTTATTSTTSTVQTGTVSAAQATTPAVASTTASTTTTGTAVQTSDVVTDEEEMEEETETTVTEITPGTGFTTDGNMVTRDLLYDEATNKQFLTVETRDGSVFYLVIDYDNSSGDGQYTTYFLNLVDDADLSALLGEETDSTEEVGVCTCSEKCAVGAIDTTCPICRVNISECAGKEIAVTTPEPTEEPETEETDSGSTGSAKSILAAVLVVAVLAGGVIFFIRNRKSKVNTRGTSDPADYDFGEEDDEEEDEIPTEVVRDDEDS